MNNKDGMSTVIADYINNRKNEKLEKLDKIITKLKASENAADQQKLEVEEQKYRDEQQKFIPNNWLEDAAKRAKQLQLTTHAPKFTHSDAKSSGVYQNTHQPIQGLVSTGSLTNCAIDVIGNAAALDVGKLLQLEYDGKALIDYVADDNIEPFMAFATSTEQANQWLVGFKQAIATDNVSSHKLSKQVYWPIDNDVDDPQYHLLAPLYATSLQQPIYETISNTRFSDLAKEAKEARRKNQTFDTPVVNFTEIAEQHFGGTKPQNISQLNSKRYGKGFLLNAQPPQWQTIKKLPLEVDTIFKGIFSNRAGKHASSLRYYLEHVFDKPSVIEIRDQRADRIDAIIDLLFGYIGEIHQFEPGWSAKTECYLPIEEQLMLDPYRRLSDEKFNQEWDKKEWPEQVAKSFSTWLNRYISGAKTKSKLLAPGKVEFVQWKVLVDQKLRLLRRDFNDFYPVAEQAQGGQS